MLLSIASLACAQGEIWVDRVEVGGRVLVPIRVVSENFGCTVNWDGAARQVTIAGANQVVMYVNNSTAYINGNGVYLDVPPRLIRSSVYVPLRFVGEALGAAVDYFGSYIDITAPGGALLRVHLATQGGGGGGGGGNYIAAWTSRRPVYDNDLRGYGNWMLTLMRNEIYARHGRPFDNPNIRSYFLNQNWYRPNGAFRESWLSGLESQNAAKIRNYQERVYGTPATGP